MKERVHTPRLERVQTGDGLDKHHHEAKTLKVLAKSAATKTFAQAKRNKAAP